MKKLLFILSFLFLISCHQYDDPHTIKEHLNTYTIPPAVVTQIIRTNEKGDSLGILGYDIKSNKPPFYYDGHSSLHIGYIYPYPDPFTKEIHLELSNPIYDIYCKFWLISAVFIDDYNGSNYDVGNQFYNSMKNKKLFEVGPFYLKAGEYKYTFNFKDKENNKNLYPAGYYRIYLQLNNYIYWHDILFDPDSTIVKKFQ
jgi:hypothetical protein